MADGKRRRSDADGKAERKRTKVVVGVQDAGEKDTAMVERPARVVYVGHVPHGFYEKEMRGFFEQFGQVKRLRLARSKKTAGSKGYGFVEFENSEVASIVADTMDGYLMFGQRLVVKVISPSELHPETFKNAGRPFRKVPWRKLEMAKRSATPTEDQIKRRAHRLARSDKRRKQRLAKLGIEYSL